MNIKELDDYLNRLTNSEIQYLKDMQRYFQLDTIQEVLKQYDSIKDKYDFPSYPTDCSHIDSIISFKKHGRFNKITEHNHSFIEMSYVYSGSIHEIINGKKISLQQGDLIILDTNIRHTFEVAGIYDILINFMISPQYFNEHFFKADYDNNIVSNFIIHTLYETKKYNDYLLFKTANHSYFHQLISYLIIEQINSDIYSSQITITTYDYI